MAVVAAAVALWAGAAASLGHVTDVAAPSEDASAEDVTAAYVAALNARDRDTVAALRQDGEAPSWAFGSVLLEGRATFADVTVSRAGEDVTGAPITDEVTVAYVPVHFNLERTWAPFPDVSMAEGPTSWGYLLERRSASEPWRITDQGVG